MFHLKRGDTGPSLQGSIVDDEGNAVNITGASVQFHMRQRGSGSVKVDKPATISNASEGDVIYNWEVEDTNEAGIFEIEWEVTFSDGTVETFPNQGFNVIRIHEAIA